jgi:Family of unknown function (DUF5985)
MHRLMYTVCALTALSCAVLLLRGYLRTRLRLLLWSGLCFVGLTLNNVLVILDRIVLPNVDLSVWRLSTTLIAVMLLLYGLVLHRSA